MKDTIDCQKNPRMNRKVRIKINPESTFPHFELSDSICCSCWVVLFCVAMISSLGYFLLENTSNFFLNCSTLVNAWPVGQKNLHQKFVIKNAPIMAIGRMYHCTPIPCRENIMANGS
jgi:hypothetical protein